MTRGMGKVAIVAACVQLAAWGPAGCAKRVGGGGPGAVPTVPVPAGNIIEHTVQPGEDWTSLAEDYYGDPDQAGSIAAFNGMQPADRPAPGSTVKLKFDDDQWEEALRRARALTPYNEGVELFADGRYGEAQRKFEQALDIAPELHSARYNLALALLKRGKAEQALAHLDRLVEERPDAEDFAFARGNALFMTSRFALAAAQFNALLQQDPGNRRAAFGYARSLQEAGDRDGAIAAWEAYLELDDDSGWADAARRNLRTLRHGD